MMIPTGDTLTEELAEEIARDIALAKNMSSITSSNEALSLANNFIYYQDIMASDIAEREYKTNQMKGKYNTVKEYMRTAKEHYKNLKELNR